MVFSRGFFICFTLLLVGQAQAAPFFVKTSGLTARSAAPLDSISTIERSIIPSEIAVRAPDGIVVPFSKREEDELLRRQDNSTSIGTGGNITVVIDNSPPAPPPGGNLNKVNPQNLPEEAAVESPNGIVQPYTKRFLRRQDNSTAANSTADNSTAIGTGGNITVVIDNSPPTPPPDGNLNKVNPQNLPEEAAVQSPNGIVQPYNKRAGRLFGRQDDSSIDNSTSTGSCNSTVVTVDNSPPPPVPEGNNDSLNPGGISDNAPTSAPNGIVTPLKRRFISSEIPTRSLNGEVELYE